MKLHTLIVILFIVGFSPNGHSQKKIIAMDADLFKNSVPLKAKAKGIRSVRRYQFGPYKVISGKAGWGSVKSGSRLFSAHYEGSSEKKLHFVFVNDKQDTLTARIVKQTILKITDQNSFVFREIFKWNDYVVKKGQSSTMAEFTTNSDTIPWSLALVYPIKVEIDYEMQDDNKTIYKGTLSKNDQSIDIRKVKTWSNGKKHFFVPAMGYELFLGEQSIAAVQTWPMNRQTVWIHSKLDPDVKFVVAGTIAALLIGLESHYNTDSEDFE